LGRTHPGLRPPLRWRGPPSGRTHPGLTATPPLEGTSIGKNPPRPSATPPLEGTSIPADPLTLGSALYSEDPLLGRGPRSGGWVLRLLSRNDSIKSAVPRWPDLHWEEPTPTFGHPSVGGDLHWEEPTPTFGHPSAGGDLYSEVLYSEDPLLGGVREAGGGFSAIPTPL
jgi:hypothetical protein